MDEATTWIEQEQKQIPAAKEFEKLPSVKFEENKPLDVTLDFSKPFEKWTDPETKKVKAIIPTMIGEIKHNWWLNTLNPIYREILNQGRAGVSTFTILQTGTANKTRYLILK